ncbi:MAG TPA: hypothetical protein VNJ07_02135 [Chitinophagales bacterium]|nr:hypothetical protein [Chitinophagales bacterium]
MKSFFLFLFLLHSALFPFNSLDSLVFDFSSDLKKEIPEDGWVKFTYNVVNYGDKLLQVQFSVRCLESGLALPFYPQTDYFTLKPGEEQSVTVFMNSQCGLFDNLDSGQHQRTLRFDFFDMNTKDELTFEQRYVLERKIR